MQKYELNKDYILDILLEEEDRLVDEINKNISESLKYTFARFLAVRNTIEVLKVENTLEVI